MVSTYYGPLGYGLSSHVMQSWQCFSQYVGFNFDKFHHNQKKSKSLRYQTLAKKDGIRVIFQCIHFLLCLCLVKGNKKLKILENSLVKCSSTFTAICCARCQVVDAQRFKVAETRQKCDFKNFLQATFSRFTSFPFPVIATTQ